MPFGLFQIADYLPIAWRRITSTSAPFRRARAQRENPLTSASFPCGQPRGDAGGSLHDGEPMKVGSIAFGDAVTSSR